MSQTFSNEEAGLLYRWLSIPRYAAVGVSAWVIAVFWGLRSLPFDPRPVLFGLVPGFIAISLLCEALVRRSRYAPAALRLQLGFDLLGVAVGAYLTGGHRSPFVLLFVLVIISASLLSRRTLITFGIATIVLYEAIGFSASTADQLTAVIFALIIGLVAFQSSYYVTRIRQKDEELLKLKDEFMFRTVHDLRSPTTVVNLLLQQHEDAGTFKNNPALQKDMDIIRQVTGRLNGLITDLLKFANGESAAFAMKEERVDVQAAIAEVAAQMQPLMSPRRIRFAHERSEQAMEAVGDPERIKEAFVNFLDNAIKYNREDGSIAVRHRVEADAVVTEISDTGIGISKESQAKLFSPFFRGDIGKEIAGTGLGLFMTRKLVQKMGGALAVRSVKGEGTTFTVSLPKYKQQLEKRA